MPGSPANATAVSEFLLLGLPADPRLRGLCAGLLLLAYLAALAGNLLIAALTSLDPRLQAPMYFFLRNLSLVDVCFISATVPKCVGNALAGSRAISFAGCAAQVFVFISSGGAEFALLLVMSYDRYAAICRPLRYEALLSRAACLHMAAASWLSGGLYGALHAAGTLSARLCGPPALPQFFCDVPSLLALACPGERALEFAFIVGSFAAAFGSFAVMVASYARILAAVLRIPSARGRAKSFSTCLPHLAVVALFLASGTVSYLGPTQRSASSLKVFGSMLYTVLPPSLNPVIYSLRNRDMQAAIARGLRRARR